MRSKMGRSSSTVKSSKRIASSLSSGPFKTNRVFVIFGSSGFHFLSFKTKSRKEAVVVAGEGAIRLNKDAVNTLLSHHGDFFVADEREETRALSFLVMMEYRYDET